VTTLDEELKANTKRVTELVVRFGFLLGCVMRYMIVVPLPWL